MNTQSFFALEGRVSRGGFLKYYGVIFLVLGAAPGMLLPHGAVQLSLEVAVVLLIVPGITKRLHDINYSLWPFVVVYAFYSAVLVIQMTGAFGDRRSLVILVSSAPFLMLMLALFVVRGTIGTNRFGPAPLGQALGD